MIQDFEKCKKVIKSCKTYEQLSNAMNMVTAFMQKNKPDIKDKKKLLDYVEFVYLLNQEQKKRLHVFQNYGLTLEGSRCMCIGNEIDPVFAGEISYFYDWDKPEQMPLPIVKKESDGKECLSMGIILPYDKELMDKLNSMPQPARWNSVCKGTYK